MIPLVTVYTVDNEGGMYAKAADQLARDCEGHGLDLHRMPFGSRGVWLRNTLLKPIGLMEWLKEHGPPCVLIDADSRVWEYPTALFEVECDVGLVPVPHNESRNPHRVRSSPVVLNEGGVPLIEAWAALARESGDEPGDHALLNELIEGFPGTVTLLPEAYSHIGQQGAVIQTGLSQSRSKRQFFQGRRDKQTRGVPGQSPPPRSE